MSVGAFTLIPKRMFLNAPIDVQETLIRSLFDEARTLGVLASGFPQGG